jgi:hypothetical protein
MKIQIMVRFLVGLLLATPAAVQAQFNYTTTNGTVTITGYTGTNDDVVIWSTIGSLPVVSIGTSAFNGSGITSLTIPDSVANIGAYAFSAADNVGVPIRGGGGPRPLTSVTIPNSVTNIGNWAFEACTRLTGVYFQSNALSFGADVFAGSFREEEIPGQNQCA